MTLTLLPLAAWAVPRTQQTQVHYVMGTYLRITADGDGAAAGMAACFREAARLEHVFSRFDGTSELSRLNAASGTSAGERRHGAAPRPGERPRG